MNQEVSSKWKTHQRFGPASDNSYVDVQRERIAYFISMEIAWPNKKIAQPASNLLTALSEATWIGYWKKMQSSPYFFKLLFSKMNLAPEIKGVIFTLPTSPSALPFNYSYFNSQSLSFNVRTCFNFTWNQLNTAIVCCLFFSSQWFDQRGWNNPKTNGHSLIWATVDSF